MIRTLGLALLLGLLAVGAVALGMALYIATELSYLGELP
jgi:hypothetical protein